MKHRTGGHAFNIALVREWLEEGIPAGYPILRKRRWVRLRKALHFSEPCES